MSLLRRVVFEYLDVSIDVLPADPEQNAVFRAAVAAHVAPYRLAARLGKLKENTAERGLAKAYAEGVIVGSITPGMEKLGMQEWTDWLLAHPEEFAQLRSICEHKGNFEDIPRGDDASVT